MDIKIDLRSSLSTKLLRTDRFKKKTKNWSKVAIKVGPPNASQATKISKGLGQKTEPLKEQDLLYFLRT